MKRLLLIPIVLMLSMAAHGQASGTTLVTATVQDSSGHLYVNCTWSVVFVGENTTPGAGPYAPAAYLNGQQGQCDSSGNLGGISGIYLADNINTVTPTPSQWSFSICSASGYVGGPYCATNILVTITGSVQNISASLTSALPLLPGSGGTVTLPNPANFPGPITTPSTLTVGGTAPQISALEFNGPDPYCMSSAQGFDQLSDCSDPATGSSSLGWDPNGNGQEFLQVRSPQSAPFSDGNFWVYNSSIGLPAVVPNVGFASATGNFTMANCASGYFLKADGTGCGPAFATTSELTGQPLYGVNNAQPAFQSPIISYGNAGNPITSGAYTPACDSTTSLVDRGRILVYASGANTSESIPQSSATGCSGMYFKGVDDGAGSMTWSRTGSDTFRVCNTQTTCSDSQTSFSLSSGQWFNAYQTATNAWDVYIEAGVVSLNTLTLGTNGGTGAGLNYKGSTSGTLQTAVSATAGTLEIAGNLELPDAGGYIWSQSSSAAGNAGFSLTPLGSGTTEAMGTSGGSSTGLFLPLNNCVFSFTTSTFTTALSPINVCQWTLPNASESIGWECYLLWSVNAGTTPTLAFGVNWANAPSATEQHATLYTTNASTASPTALQSGNTSTSNANFITTGTLSTSSTLFQSSMFGAFVSSATSGTFSITATLTGTSATGTLAGHCILQ